jgi:hypothetical protein
MVRKIIVQTRYQLISSAELRRKPPDENGNPFYFDENKMFLFFVDKSNKTHKT